MKKTLLTLLTLVAVAAVSFGSSVKTIANESALTYNQTFDYDANRNGNHQVSAQVIYSSATPSPSSFTDGRVSTGSITVVTTTGLSATSATNQITLPLDSAILQVKATDYMTVLSTNGLVGLTLTFTDAKGHIAKLKEGVDWARQTTATGTANAITTAWAQIGSVKVSSSGAVMYATATVAGVFGNSFTLTSSSPTAISINALNFSNGRSDPMLNSEIVCNGVRLRRFYQWKEASTSTGTAVNLKAALNHVGGISCSTGTVSGHPVVFATATVAGAAANAFTLTTNAANAFTVAGATFSGGKDAAAVTIGGIELRNARDWTAVATASGTARAISNAIQANATLAAAISSTFTAGGVVTTTSTAVGNVNYTLVSNTSALTVSHPTMVGAALSAYTISTKYLTIPAHGLGLGQGVVFSTGSAFGLSPLALGTTYYAAPIDANTIALATSVSTARAGTYITFTSSSIAGPHTFTLTPSVYAGTASFKWQASNDGSLFNDLSVSSVTIGSPSSTPTSAVWDFGNLSYRYLRLNVVAPTAGGLKLQATINASKE